MFKNREMKLEKFLNFELSEMRKPIIKFLYTWSLEMNQDKFFVQFLSVFRTQSDQSLINLEIT